MDSLKWERNSEHMREFFRLQPAYEQLIEEVSFTIKSRLNHSGIEFAHIAQRVKSPESFLEKIDRERYQDPIREITDLAGVRLVFLYLDDLPAIEAMIRKAFIVDEKVNKESVDIETVAAIQSFFDVFGALKPIFQYRNVNLYWRLSRCLDQVNMSQMKH
ncbi:MAG: RelA/SpoT domain-containing protein, partial [Phycisphaerae bacterium]|nr:RelA/SpoT domain-containing protein [Phycisphaerae bacterium]